MTRQVFRISDLTGEPILNADDATKLIVEHHPAFPGEQIELDVLPEQVEGSLSDATEFVTFAYFFPGDDVPQHFVLPLEEFAGLFPEGTMNEALERALNARKAEEKAQKAAEVGEEKPKLDYASPEHAGKPHQGRISAKEKAYVSEHLEEVNARLEREGLPSLDPTDPKTAERYGLTPTEE